MAFTLLLFTTIFNFQVTFPSAGNDPLVTKKTDKEASVVVKELKQIIEKKGLQIFNEISHHTGAEKAGEQLRFTHVIIFGNPKVGTKLMQCDQQIGYELPLRMLVTTNKEGQTLVSFQDPKNYMNEYEVKECKSILEKMSNLMHEITNEVL